MCTNGLTQLTAPIQRMGVLVIALGVFQLVRGLPLSQVLLEECCQPVEGDLVHAVVQINVIRIGDNQQFFRIRGSLENVLGVITRVSVLAGDQ